MTIPIRGSSQRHQASGDTHTKTTRGDTGSGDHSTGTRVALVTQPDQTQPEVDPCGSDSTDAGQRQMLALTCPPITISYSKPQQPHLNLGPASARSHQSAASPIESNTKVAAEDECADVGREECADGGRCTFAELARSAGGVTLVVAIATGRAPWEPRSHTRLLPAPLRLCAGSTSRGVSRFSQSACPKDATAAGSEKTVVGEALRAAGATIGRGRCSGRPACVDIACFIDTGRAPRQGSMDADVHAMLRSRLAKRRWSFPVACCCNCNCLG